METRFNASEQSQGQSTILMPSSNSAAKLTAAVAATVLTILNASPIAADDGGTPLPTGDCNCETEYDAGYKEGDAQGFIAGHEAGRETGYEQGYNEAEDNCKKRCEKINADKKQAKKPRKKSAMSPVPARFIERNPNMPSRVSFPCVLRTDYGENSGYKLTMALPDNAVERESDVKIGDLTEVAITRLHNSGDITINLGNVHKANRDDALTYEMTIDPDDMLERTTTCQLERTLPPKTSTGGDCPRQIQFDIETQVVGGFLDGTLKEGPDDIKKPKDMECATYHLPGIPPEADFYCWTEVPNFQTGESDICTYGTALKQPLPPENPKKPRKPEEIRANLRHTLLLY
ncbi:hypothetical protein HZC21_00300 [Candidatus Peregrinibacteria bacterium]|nr:hypothetical protein [Candidatus Peregrinibacteria bacterium]